MLDELAEADAARVRADRHAELGRQQQDRHDLIDTRQPAGVDLAEGDGVRLHELLEDDPILAVLAGGDTGGRPISRAIAAWPRMSSGLVGSSIQYGSNSARAPTLSIASPTSQTWLASIISNAGRADLLADDQRAPDVVRSRSRRP